MQHVKKYGQHAMAGLASFLIMAGTFIIVHMLILQRYYTGVDISPGAPYILFLLLAMLVFFIVELNRCIEQSSIAIGLVMAVLLSLPFLFAQVAWSVSWAVVGLSIVANMVALPLASYVFVLMRE